VVDCESFWDESSLYESIAYDVATAPNPEPEITNVRETYIFGKNIS
jgi:hypothetical protein